MALNFFQLAPELGQFSLILALCLSAALFVLPLLGAHYGSNVMMQSGRSLATGFFIFIAFLMLLCMTTFPSNM
jgi:cytochrome c-type biogenesis protein CcmF